MLFLQLNPIGLTYLNLLVMFLTRFSIEINESIILQLLPYTLKHQYHIEKDLASTAGELMFGIKLISIVTIACVGVMFDLFSRRYILAVSYLICTIGIVLLSQETKLTWYLISRVLWSFQGITFNCPFIPDYISPQSIGLANSYMMITTSLANFTAARLVGATAKKYVTDTLIYNILSALSLFVGFFVLFFMKDNKPLENGSQKQKLKLIFSQSFKLIKQEVNVGIGIFNFVSACVIAICCSTYTVYVVNDAYKEMGKSEDQAKEFLSLTF